ncbi:MAG: DUF3168 domain-containing protein [Sulfuricurvum sp.]
MSIAIDLFNILKLIPEIGGRVYPSVLPQNPTYPAIVYQRISSIDTGTIEGTESLDMGRFQIKVFAKTYKAAVENAELVKTAMSGNGNKVGHMDDYENETQLHVQILDYIL